MSKHFIVVHPKVYEDLKAAYEEEHPGFWDLIEEDIVVNRYVEEGAAYALDKKLAAWMDDDEV